MLYSSCVTIVDQKIYGRNRKRFRFGDQNPMKGIQLGQKIVIAKQTNYRNG